MFATQVAANDTRSTAGHRRHAVCACSTASSAPRAARALGFATSNRAVLARYRAESPFPGSVATRWSGPATCSASTKPTACSFSAEPRSGLYLDQTRNLAFDNRTPIRVIPRIRFAGFADGAGVSLTGPAAGDQNVFAGLGLAETHADLLRNVLAARLAGSVRRSGGRPADWNAAVALELATKPPFFTSPLPVIDRPFEDARWNDAIGYPFRHWIAQPLFRRQLRRLVWCRRDRDDGPSKPNPPLAQRPAARRRFRPSRASASSGRSTACAATRRWSTCGRR